LVRKKQRSADADSTQRKVEVALDRLEPIANALGALDPKTPAQTDALAAAKANLALMEQTRLLMSLQLSSPVAWSLVTSVIFWSMFLSCGFGVLSGTNPTTIVALALGAISVASAMFLVLDLTLPYSACFGFRQRRSNRRSRRSTNSASTRNYPRRSTRRARIFQLRYKPRLRPHCAKSGPSLPRGELPSPLS
jgi:hypothetical protein